MDKQQTLELLRLLMTYYRNFSIGSTEKEQLDTINAWYEFLHDQEPTVIFQNAKNFIREGGAFAPNVGQLLPKKKEFNGPYVPNAEETRKRFEEQERIMLETQKALQDPAMQENIAKIKADIRRMLEKKSEG